MKDKTIDNQQVSLFFDIGYILGLIDGEGSCQIVNKYLKTKNPVYSPKISIFNSNPNIIQLAIDSLKRLEIAFWIYTPRMHGKETLPNYRLEIVGIKRVKKAVDLLLQFSSGKEESLKILQDFCNYRLSESAIDNNKTQFFYNKLKELNKQWRSKTKTSETIRFT